LIHREERSHLVATGGLYAPTIRFHNGTFYIVCTNVVHQSPDGSNDELQNFVISTTDIYASNWSDPVYFDFYGIDPSLFFDADGKAYLCGSKSPGPETKITLFELDVKTGKKLTDEKQLWHGTGGIYPEGPHIYFHNSFYYLMIAEGGTHEGHSVTMARSKSLWGPYEPSPLNPILSAAGTDEYVQATGHCEAFEGKDGEWWGVCLGIRQGADGLYGLGRETFLTKGKWSDDGWLKFDRAKVHLDGFADVQEHARLTAAPSTDLLYIHDPELSRYKVSDRVITLIASSHDLTAAEASPTFIGKRQRRLEGKSSVTILNSSQNFSGTLFSAGLAVYKDEHRLLRAFYYSQSHSVKLQVLNKAKDIDRSEEHKIEGKFESLRFLIQYTEMEYKVSYGVNGADMIELGKVETLELSDKDFVGPIVGVCAVSEDKASETLEVSFEDFVVDSA
jgi:beta-xylosidase